MANNLDLMNKAVRQLSKRAAEEDNKRLLKLTTVQRDALTVAQATAVGYILNTTTDSVEKYDTGTSAWIVVSGASVVKTVEFLDTPAKVTAAQILLPAATDNDLFITFATTPVTYAAIPLDILDVVPDPADTLLGAGNATVPGSTTAEFINYVNIFEEDLV